MSQARASAKARKSPDIVTAMNSPALFGPWFQGASWDGWRAVLKAAFALPMTNSEIEFFRTVAERDPPKKRVREAWIIAGRRAGKDSVASMIAAHSAALFNGKIAFGQASAHWSHASPTTRTKRGSSWTTPRPTLPRSTC